MQTGLRNTGPCEAIADAMLAVNETWEQKSPQDRIKAISDVVREQLKLLGVAPPSVRMISMKPERGGTFDNSTWQLSINPDFDPGEELDQVGRVGQLGMLIAHESRHCEQVFRIARLLAERRRAKGLQLDRLSAPLIGKEMNVPTMPVAAAIAIRTALTPQERREAEAWYESIYGKGASGRDLILKTFQKLKPVDTGAVTVSDPSLIHQVGDAVRMRLYSHYQRDLPYEDDAWSTGAEVEQRFYDKLMGVGARRGTQLINLKKTQSTGVDLPLPPPPQAGLPNLPPPDLSNVLPPPPLQVNSPNLALPQGAMAPPPLPFGNGQGPPRFDPATLPPPVILPPRK